MSEQQTTLDTIFKNYPPEADTWLEDIVAARRWAESDLAPGIDRAMLGSTMITAYALRPFRGLTNPQLREWAFGEISGYFNEKGTTARDQARAIIRYITNQLPEKVVRGASDVISFSVGTVLYLDHILDTGLWVPDRFPLNVEQIVAKIDAIGGIFVGKDLWEQVIIKMNEDRRELERKEKNEIERLKARELNKTLKQYRSDNHNLRLAEENRKRAAVVLPILKQMTKTATPFDDKVLPEDADVIEIAYRVPGTGWTKFDTDMSAYLVACIQKK